MCGFDTDWLLATRFTSYFNLVSNNYKLVYIWMHRPLCTHLHHTQCLHGVHVAKVILREINLQRLAKEFRRQTECP